MARQILNDDESGAIIRDKINDNFEETYQFIENGVSMDDSDFYDTKTTLQIQPILTEGVGQANLEILNIGNWNPSPQGTESRNLNPAGLWRAMGNPVLFRNVKFNEAQERFEQVNTASDSYGSTTIEAGGEGANFNHVPPGTHPYQSPVGMLFSVRGNGTRGIETALVAGYVNQAMAPLFMSYHSSGNFSQLAYWSNAAADPMLHLHTKEAKGTDNEMFVLQANASSATVYAGQYFQKSRGTMASKTVVSADDIGGRIGWKYYDGNSYELTAVIQSVAKGTIGDGNAGASIQFLTSATNTAGLTKVLELMDGNQIGFFNVTPVARQVVATGSSIDAVITALQNLGLFSQT